MIDDVSSLVVCDQPFSEGDLGAESVAVRIHMSGENERAVLLQKFNYCFEGLLHP